MATEPLESKRYTTATVVEAAATTAQRDADRAVNAARSALQSLDVQVRNNIAAWSLERQTSERERLTWEYNVACANKLSASDALKKAKAETKAAKAAWLADPAAREAAAQRYVVIHRHVNDLLAELRGSIRELDKTNATWQAMSQAQQPDVYLRFNADSILDATQRAKDLMWILDGRGDLFLDLPHMTREAAKLGVTVPAA